MEKLNDNKLLECWNMSSLENNSMNEIFENTYLRYTNCFELKSSSVISTRVIGENEKKMISIVYKKFDKTTIPIYSLVVFDISEDLPPEKSRIAKYCQYKNNNFDMLETIINYRTNQLIQMLNISIDEKFRSLVNHNFKSIKHKLAGNKELVDILIKPETLDLPPMNNILSELPQILYNKKKAIESFKNQLLEEETILKRRANMITAPQSKQKELTIIPTNQQQPQATVPEIEISSHLLDDFSSYIKTESLLNTNDSSSTGGKNIVI